MHVHSFSLRMPLNINQLKATRFSPLSLYEMLSYTLLFLVLAIKLCVVEFLSVVSLFSEAEITRDIPSVCFSVDARRRENFQGIFGWEHRCSSPGHVGR